MSRTSSVIALSITTSLITSSLTFLALQLWMVPKMGSSRKTVEEPPKPAAVEVPKVTGLRPDDAKIILRERDLLLTLAKTNAHPTVAAGLIHTQMPLAGSLIVPGESVVVEVSSGPPPAAVPLVVGRNINAGRMELEKLGLTVSVKTREDKSSAADQILSQSIEPGLPAPAGGTIELVVAVAPVALAVPDYRGKYFRRKEIAEELEKLGLTVGRVRYTDRSDRPNGFIYSTSPEAGTQVQSGTAVDFTVQAAED